MDFRKVYFSAVLAAAHDFACLRIARPVAGTYFSRRSQGWLPVWRGYALTGRDSHPLDDCFTFPGSFKEFVGGKSGFAGWRYEMMTV